MPTTSDTKIAASFPGLAHGARARSLITGRRWHGHGYTSMLHRRDVEAGVQPRVSTGRSIHAVLSITRLPREGIEDGLRLCVRMTSQSRWPRPTSRAAESYSRQVQL